MEDGQRKRELLREKEKMEEESKKARLAAEARVRARLQRRIGDIIVYRINVRADVKEFRDFIKLRYRRMTEIASTISNGKPVTPTLTYDDDPEEFDEDNDPRPEEERCTFHIVELVDDDFDYCVQMLFRETDLYFLAFRVLDRHADPESTDGWFRFKNERLPSFLQSRAIYYHSAYGNISTIKVGFGSLLDIFHGLRKYTPNTATDKTDQNERVLRAASLVFSEVQRLKSVQRNFMRNLANGTDRDLHENDKLIHQWSGMGKDVFGRDTAGSPETELGDCSENQRVSRLEGSPDNEVWIFKYNARLTPGFIVRQQKLEAMKSQNTKP